MSVTRDVLRYCVMPVIDWRYSILPNQPQVEVGLALANDGSKTTYLTYSSMLDAPKTQEGNIPIPSPSRKISKIVPVRVLRWLS